MSGKTAKAGQLGGVLGFLTVRFDAAVGYVGGYLLLNSSGRPLEFHCTAPVRPNRAQEILYGPTLQPYLYGEQIGRALWDKAGKRPLLLVTDVEPALSLGALIDAPMVLVAEAQVALAAPPAATLAAAAMLAAQAGPGLRLGCNQVLAAPGRAEFQSVEAVQAAWIQCESSIDLLEPFQRISSALTEAQAHAA